MGGWRFPILADEASNVNPNETKKRGREEPLRVSFWFALAAAGDDIFDHAVVDLLHMLGLLIEDVAHEGQVIGLLLRHDVPDAGGIT